MKTYTIKPLTEAPDVAAIECYPWDNGYSPRAEARLSWSEAGLYVEMTAWERTISAVETRTGGAVSGDSCLEFFFQPLPDTDPRYINCEINAGGVMHIGVGKGRERRKVLQRLPDGMDVVASIQPGEHWGVRCTVTTALIAQWFKGFEPKSGMVLRGNFYTCDESIHPHFGCWNPVAWPTPDFHRPECFGRLILA